MSCWNPKVEMMPGDELHGLQLKLLKSLVYRLYSFSPFYRERMDAAPIPRPPMILQMTNCGSVFAKMIPTEESAKHPAQT